MTKTLKRELTRQGAGVIARAFCLGATALALLQSCSTNAPQPWRIAPVFRAEGVRDASQLSQSYFRTGRSREEQAYPVSAEDYYHQAIQLDPENIEARNALGVLLALQGRLNEAIATLRAAPLIPSRGQILGNLGYIYRLAGRPAEATEYLEEASQIDPKNIWVDSRLVFAWQQRSQQALRKTTSPLKAKTTSRMP